MASRVRYFVGGDPLQRDGPQHLALLGFWAAWQKVAAGDLEEVAHPDRWVTPQPKVQRRVTDAVSRVAMERAESVMSSWQRARRSEGAVRGAAAVMTAPPSEAAFSLSDREMALFLRARLALPMYASGMACRHCGSGLDAAGEHPHSCPGRQTRRHDAVEVALATDMRHYGLLVAQQPTGGGV